MTQSSTGQTATQSKKPSKRSASSKKTQTNPLNPQAATAPLSLEELAASMEINARLTFGDTLLLRAIITHEIDFALKLIRQGADPNLTDRSGRSPLLYASGASYQKAGENEAPHQLSKDQRLILALLAAGADPNATPPGNARVNALEGALFYRNIWCCIALLKGGAQLEQLDDKGQKLLAKLSGEDLSAFESEIMNQGMNRESDAVSPSRRTSSIRI